MGRAARRTGESHRRTAPGYGDNSRPAAARPRGATSFARASQLPCRPDRVRREIVARKRLEIFEHSTWQVGRIQPGAKIRAASCPASSSLCASYSEMKPGGASVIIPRLVCRDPDAEITFCARTFDAIEGVRRPAPDGGVAHALMTIGPAMIMIEREWPTVTSRAPKPDGSSPVVIFVYVDDVDFNARTCRCWWGAGSDSGKGSVLGRPHGVDHGSVRARL